MPNPRQPRPTVAKNLWSEFSTKMVAAKNHLARVEDLMRRDKLRFIHVPRVTVREHTRAAHWRVYVPPLRRS